MEKQVIILTKSAKHGGHCVAGIDVNTGKWIRLVSDDEETDGALTDDDLTYEDGNVCEVLDIVNVTCVRAAPTENQPENFLINQDRFFVKNGVATLDEVLHRPNICMNDKLYTIYATNAPYVKVAAWNEYLSKGYSKYSLMLVRVQDLVIYRNSNNKVKADFNFRNKREDVIEYTEVSVTDPDFFHRVEDDGFNIPDAYLVVSFPNGVTHSERLHEDVYYKFIAKIFSI